MAQFFAEAGVVVWFVLLCGVLAFGHAVSFVYRPSAKKRAVTDALIRATAFASLVGFSAGVAATLQAVQSAFQGTEPDAIWWQLLIVGVRESSGSLILGFAWCALAGLFVGIGLWREKV